MSVDYKGLLQGNISVIDVAKAIGSLYGGEHFQMRFGNENVVDFGFGLGKGIDSGHYVLTFDQEFSPEVKAMRPWERKPHRIHRQMHVFTDGACASDYKDITSDPMTYVSLGHWGECKEIINALVAHFGGYICDEAGADEWEALSNEAMDAALASNKARLAMIAAKEAEYAEKAAEKMA